MMTVREKNPNWEPQGNRMTMINAVPNFVKLDWEPRERWWTERRQFNWKSFLSSVHFQESFSVVDAVDPLLTRSYEQIIIIFQFKFGDKFSDFFFNTRIVGEWPHPRFWFRGLNFLCLIHFGQTIEQLSPWLSYGGPHIFRSCVFLRSLNQTGQPVNAVINCWKLFYSFRMRLQSLLRSSCPDPPAFLRHGRKYWPGRRSLFLCHATKGWPRRMCTNAWMLYSL